MNSAPKYSPAPTYSLKLASRGEKPPVAMAAIAWTDASSAFIPMAAKVSAAITISPR